MLRRHRRIELRHSAARVSVDRLYLHQNALQEAGR
jgi:hypothetical protein